MKITRGRIAGAHKVVVYGPEGIGKTTFASRFPDPLFIDTEGSTKYLDVARVPKPESWNELLQEIKWVIENPDCCKTLVIDTIDWAERLCVEHVLKENGKNGIEDFGYGKGYIYVAEAFEKSLKLLDEVIRRGINVVLTAHCLIRKFEQPDEMGAYDRYELKLGKKTASQTAPLVKEWSDMLLFANYKTVSVATDDKGKNHKAQGGRRVMYTAHHPCWDAKNRHGLDDELDFDFKYIAHIFDEPTRTATKKEIEREETEKVEREFEAAIDEEENPPQSAAQADPPRGSQNNEPLSVSSADSSPQGASRADNIRPYGDAGRRDVEGAVPYEDGGRRDVEGAVPYEDGGRRDVEAPSPTETSGSRKRGKARIPPELRKLMENSAVTEEDIQKAVSKKGYFPADMTIEDYPEDFVKDCLIGAWDQVYDMILKDADDMPF